MFPGFSLTLVSIIKQFLYNASVFINYFVHLLTFTKRAPGAPAGTRQEPARVAENAEITEIAENRNDPRKSLLL